MNKKAWMKKTIVIFGKVIIYVAALMFFPIPEIIQNRDNADTSLWRVRTVFAQIRPTEAVPVKDGPTAYSTHDSPLMNNLLEKQKQLDNRDKALKEEERKIEVLKKEVTEKIETLRTLEEKMSPALETQKMEKNKKYQTLAKMYEATPDEKAAIIFEKMDRKMAAEIMLRMNSKKAGAVWAKIDRNIGVEIVREITASQSVNAASAAKIAKEISGDEVKNPETSPKVVAETASKTGKEISNPEVTKHDVSQRKGGDVSPKTSKKNAAVEMIKPDASKATNTSGVQKEKPKMDGSRRVKSKAVQPAVNKPFSIQIKAVRDPAVAREYVKMLREEGIDAYLSPLNIKGKETLYRLLVGHFINREVALNYMKNRRIESSYPGSFIYKSEQAYPKKKKK